MEMRVTKGARIGYRHYSSRLRAVDGQIRTWVAYGKVFLEIAPLGIMEFGEEEFGVFAEAVSQCHAGIMDARAKATAAAGREV